jgi:hypothetical protein
MILNAFYNFTKYFIIYKYRSNVIQTEQCRARAKHIIYIFVLTNKLYYFKLISNILPMQKIEEKRNERYERKLLILIGLCKVFKKLQYCIKVRIGEERSLVY